MKKHLLRLFVTALCVAAINTITARQLFVVGTDNVWETSKAVSGTGESNMAATISEQLPECIYILGSDGTWNPAAPSATLEPVSSEPGLYGADVTISNDYFALGGMLGESESDWTTFNAHRYGPDTPDRQIAVGESLQLYEGVDRSFKVAIKGDYHITVNLNNMTVTLSGVLPEQVYIVDCGVGNVPDYVNPTATLTQTEPNSGLYKGAVTFTGKTFGLGTKMGDSETFLSNSYGLYSASPRVRINEMNEILLKPKWISLDDPGTYDVTIDLNRMLIVLEKYGYEPANPYYLTFESTDGSYWTYFNESEVPNVYVGGMYLDGSSYTITSFNKNVSPDFDGVLKDNVTMPVTVGSDAPKPFYFNASPDNAYYAYIAVDLNNNRILFYGNDYSYPDGYPNELYVIGDTQGWFYNIPTCVLSKTDVEGVYAGDVTLKNGDYFSILQRIGNSWDFVNGRRMFPINDGAVIGVGESDDYVEYSEYNSGAWMFDGNDGTYTLTVDMRFDKITISDKSVVGVNAVAEAANDAQQPMYDLSGRRVNTVKPASGIYVKQGKKIVVK